MYKSEQHHLIVGLGKTGFSCAKFCASRNIPFSIVDSRQAPPLLDAFKKQFPNVEIHLGEFASQVFQKADVLIVSPGVSIHEDVIQQCIGDGIEVVGDIELFAREATAPIVAVTGSNGKSTVVSLLGEMARQAGVNALVGANLGVPALDLLETDEPDFYILELSSFQLETCPSLKPYASCILNISADHMDRYESFDEYKQAKKNIYHGAEHIVYNRDDENTKPAIHGSKSAIRGSKSAIRGSKSAIQGSKSVFPAERSENRDLSFGFNKPDANSYGIITKDNKPYIAFGNKLIIACNELKIHGRHNWANAMAALALSELMHLPSDSTLEALKQFKGLDHRCQWVRTINGVDWYNDSKATNVGATIAAVTGIANDSDGKIILILGGQGKQQDFSLLKNTLQQYVSQTIVYGEDADNISTVINNYTHNVRARDLSEAVMIAHEQSKSKDSVVFAPACASFDMFRDYIDRGEQFIKLVRDLPGMM